MKTIILGIETSCDETAIALIEASGGISGKEPPKFKMLRNLVASQIKIHAPFGGVVPNLAKREHLRNLPILWKQISRVAYGANRKSKSLNSKSSILNSIDLIAVTVGPGLEPALWTGINFAKDLKKTLHAKPYTLHPTLVGANHLEGHLYSFLLPQEGKSQIANRKSLNSSKIFPAIALIVSGGHTILLKMDSLTKWKKLGETRDDAVGEAYDKVARLLGLPYPGGPEIERLARSGNPEAIAFPRPMLHDKSYDFSFSGLKTSVLYYLRDNLLTPKNHNLKPNIAASFQAAAIDVLAIKTFRAAEEFSAKSVMLSGGVASNKLLRKTLKKESEKRGLKFFVSEFSYNTDNAVMIAAAGYLAHLRGKKYKLVARGDFDI